MADLNVYVFLAAEDSDEDFAELGTPGQVIKHAEVSLEDPDAATGLYKKLAELVERAGGETH